MSDRDILFLVLYCVTSQSIHIFQKCKKISKTTSESSEIHDKTSENWFHMCRINSKPSIVMSKTLQNVKTIWNSDKNFFFNVLSRQKGRKNKKKGLKSQTTIWTSLKFMSKYSKSCKNCRKLSNLKIKYMATHIHL